MRRNGYLARFYCGEAGKRSLWSKHFDIEFRSQCRIWNLGSIYTVRPVVNGKPREAPWRPWETTKASSRTRILAPWRNLVLYQHCQDPQSYACLGNQTQSIVTLLTPQETAAVYRWSSYVLTHEHRDISNSSIFRTNCHKALFGSMPVEANSYIRNMFWDQFKGRVYKK